MPSGRVFSGKKVDIGTVNTLLGTVTISGTVSGGGGGVQYSQGDTTIAATGTGTIFFGITATTARAIKVAGDGTVFVSGGGGGVQYVQGGTQDTAGKTGTVILGVSATTAYALAIASTGGLSYINTVNFIAAGTVDAVVSGTVTALPSGTQNVIVIGTPAVTVGTGLINISGTVPVTLASLATGTVSISGTSTVVFGATQPISGSVSVVNTPTVTIGGTASAFLLAGTARAGSLFLTAHPTNWNAVVIATTSAAAGVIVQTSGAHTLYITDLLVNVAGPMSVTLCSETTAKMYLVGLATNGGFAMNNVSPMVLNSAQSLRVVPGSSGSCSVFAAGYTVT